MKAKHGNEIVDIWQITKDEDKIDDWVKEAIEQRKIGWSRTEPDYLSVPQPWSASFGKVGEYLAFQDDTFKIVSDKSFKKDYQVID